MQAAKTYALKRETAKVTLSCVTSVREGIHAGVTLSTDTNGKREPDEACSFGKIEHVLRSVTLLRTDLNPGNPGHDQQVNWARTWTTEAPSASRALSCAESPAPPSAPACFLWKTSTCKWE